MTRWSFARDWWHPYVRRAKTLDATLPWLYGKGISSGQMSEAVEVVVGPEAKVSRHVLGAYRPAARIFGLPVLKFRRVVSKRW